MRIKRTIEDLFYMPRSIISEPTRKTMRYIKKHIPKISIIKFKSGKKVFDWVVPNEWNINDAYIMEPNGKENFRFRKNLLSIVYHSSPVKMDIKSRAFEEDTL